MRSTDTLAISAAAEALAGAERAVGGQPGLEVRSFDELGPDPNPAVAQIGAVDRNNVGMADPRHPARFVHQTPAGAVDIARPGVAELERDFTIEDVHAADEAFVTGTFGGITPANRIDDVAFERGPVTRRLQELYAARVERECAS